MLLLVVWLLAQAGHADWRQSLRPVSEEDAVVLEQLAHEGAAYSIAVVKRNVMCRFGSADNCADGGETVHTAQQRSASPFRMREFDRLAAKGICHLNLAILAESWEIQWGLARILEGLRQPGFGRDRLFVMEQRKELAESHKVVIESVEACIRIDTVFAAHLDRAGKAFHLDMADGGPNSGVPP